MAYSLACSINIYEILSMSSSCRLYSALPVERSSCVMWLCVCCLVFSLAAALCPNHLLIIFQGFIRVTNLLFNSPPSPPPPFHRVPFPLVEKWVVVAW